MVHKKDSEYQCGNLNYFRVSVCPREDHKQGDVQKSDKLI